MKQKHYTDSSPSREVEDDMEEFDKDIELPEDYSNRQKSILDVRDELNNMRDLVDVCSAALLGPENQNKRIQQNVAHVLYFYIDPIIKKLEEELAKQ
jgi:hypothetical protein